MATINAAAAKHVSMRGTIAALAVIFAGALAGCSTNGGSLLDGANSPLAVGSTQLTAPAAARAKIAIAPVIGAPDNIAKQIRTQLTAETAKKNIAVAQSATDKVDYTLRGYIVAAREATATKVSYIWDVTNPTGARVHRITGEEIVNGAGAGDPWASVSPALIQNIVAKTTNGLDSWMPQKAANPAAATPKQPAANNAVAANRQANPIATAGINPQPVGAVTALVPNVVGAPGDGSTSLASALRNELMRNGVRPAPPGGQRTYRVEGRVAMGPVQGGQQPIKIDWVVKDPRGASLGTVSQENKIPAGSLNGAWGSTANAAATAATQGILKLLPKQTASR